MWKFAFHTEKVWNEEIAIISFYDGTLSLNKRCRMVTYCSVNGTVRFSMWFFTKWILCILFANYFDCRPSIQGVKGLIIIVIILIIMRCIDFHEQSDFNIIWVIIMSIEENCNYVEMHLFGHSLTL